MSSALGVMWIGPADLANIDATNLETVAAIFGPPGRDGEGASPTIERAAGEALGGHRAVKIVSDGTARYAGGTDADAAATIGITTGAAAMGDNVTIQIGGEMIEGSWSWTPGAVWLGTNGLLTQTAPATGKLVQVGTAASPTSLVINPRLIAQL